MFVVTVEFQIAPVHLAAFAEAMTAQARNSLEREAGCLRFDVCQAPERPELTFLYEIYADEAAFQAHLASDHFRDFDAKVAPWVVDKVVKTWIMATAGSNLSQA